jgi:ribosomal protein L11
MKSKSDLNITKIVYIQSQNAEAAPPLGTILGNVGVNTVKFCDEFNKFTMNLSSYLIVKVKIDINENKTFKFSILSLNITYLINLLKFRKILKKDKEFNCISLKNVILLALFKFPNLILEYSLRIFCGILKSMNIIILK